MAGSIIVGGKTLATHTNTNSLKLENSVFPAGHIINATFSSDLSTYKANTTSNYVTTGLSLPVNKLINSSYILIQVNANLQQDSSQSDSSGQIKIYDTTNARTIGATKNFRLATAYGTTANIRVISQPPTYFTVWDTNSGTGSRTYDFQFRLLEINDGTNPSSNMFALEIMQ